MAMKVGIQLFSVKEAMAKDPIAAIKEVADIGYKYLEVANFDAAKDPGCGFGMSPEQVLSSLEGTGARIISSHIGNVTEETVGEVIKWHKAVGNTMIGQSADMYTGYDHLMERCEFYNKIGKILADEGMKFLFHNHFHEFVKINGKTIYDIVLENTDPNYVTFELDTFWAMRGGQNPIELLKKMEGRVFSIHQKDFSKLAVFDHNINLLAKDDTSLVAGFEDFAKYGSKPTDFCEVGTGIMPIQEILDAANAAGVQYCILEQDATQKTEMESIKISMDSFHKYTGIEFE
ncbi:MAG: sugar phosphate isomerase/epimerase [Clostridia bacterium]|nr:sugar phosphate isomerase/epimerase [Clostridia bacterium]